MKRCWKVLSKKKNLLRRGWAEGVNMGVNVPLKRLSVQFGWANFGGGEEFRGKAYWEVMNSMWKMKEQRVSGITPIVVAYEIQQRLVLPTPRRGWQGKEPIIQTGSSTGGFTETSAEQVSKRDKRHGVPTYGSATKLKVFEILASGYLQYAPDSLDLEGWHSC